MLIIHTYIGCLCTSLMSSHHSLKPIINTKSPSHFPSSVVGLACVLVILFLFLSLFPLSNRQSFSSFIFEQQKKMVGTSPCASCKLLRRRCAADCIFAPYFPSDDPHKFAIVHKVFGASNISKMLQELPIPQRADAVSSLVFEANARLRDPVYGCVGAISYLQNQVSQLQMQLAVAQAEILCIQMQQETDQLPHHHQFHNLIDPTEKPTPSNSSLLQYSSNLSNLSQLLNIASSGNVVIQDPLKRESLWT